MITVPVESLRFIVHNLYEHTCTRAALPLTVLLRGIIEVSYVFSVGIHVGKCGCYVRRAWNVRSKINVS